MLFIVFFFFSSRRRHTRWTGDWSSDVCSSDLYATLHFLLYAVIDQGLGWSAIVADVSKRGFITVGFVAWLLLIPLALTSTAAMTKRLGAKRWKQLHRLSYVVAILAAIHFIWRVKRD